MCDTKQTVKTHLYFREGNLMFIYDLGDGASLQILDMRP
ncbi:hypothetical protein Krac_0423 [Ktedonobacter racemifer DSM 44963]|uniref:MBL fold metallo-hydrolase n=1 Tax=Ktedonobacter racemifer DSM 44963 TaxID=485913 RepID=D6U7N7_KTERA|nr:hypothetical protein Krac_0423 [Ktedonobacter racemifer DSM 44963]